MKKLMIFKYKLIFLLMILLAGSCTESGDDNDVLNEPVNLVVEITVSDTDPKSFTVIAQADNTVEYRLFLDSQPEPEESNTSGEFEIVFTTPGNHLVTVRAYGSSGKYMKYERTLSIPIDDPITTEDGYITPLSYSGLELAWNDEFDGTTINTSNWTFEIGTGCPNNCGWGNNESEYYRKENASVDNGTLVIEARKEQFQGSSYTSARMITKDKKSFKYGRIDIRALLPKGQGMWPALWMLGNDISTVGWPKSGEIDIMEMIGGSGREKTVHGVLHWDNNGHVQAGGQYTLQTGMFADEYHVFTLTWDEHYIKWFVNDVQFHVIDITPSHMTEYHQPGFFIFNLAVGGTWPGYPNASTEFPQQLKVDYIRVFQ